MARAGHFLIPGHVITNCEPNPACSVAIHPDHSASEVASAAVSKSFENDDTSSPQPGEVRGVPFQENGPKRGQSF